MKSKLLLAMPIIILAGCSTGRVDTVKDQFTGEASNVYDVGQIKSDDSFGLIHEIRCKILKKESKNKSVEYYIKLYTYAETLEGHSCPTVKAHSKAIFVVNGHNIEFRTGRDSNVDSKRVGFFGPGCMETDIDIGPISKDELMQMVSQKELKFRVYGQKFNLTGSIQTDDLSKVKNFLLQY